MVNRADKLPLPMEGTRVLDVTHIVAGPFCSMILADLGAEVIKIERPGVGERGRSNGPFIQGADGQQVSARYLGLNRNKKSVTLDLREPRCKDVLLNMVRVSDVLLDNWGPGALRRLGLGYEVLREANPSLVYASITGYGDSDDLQGPGHRPARDGPRPLGPPPAPQPRQGDGRIVHRGVDLIGARVRRRSSPRWRFVKCG